MIWPIAIVLVFAAGVAYFLVSPPQTQRFTPQPPAQEPDSAPSVPPQPTPKKPLPQEAIAGVGWLYGLYFLYLKNGVYAGPWFTSELMLKILSDELKAISAAATGNYLAVIGQAISALSSLWDFPGKMSANAWGAYNIASMYVEKVGPPPTAAWVILAAHGYSTPDLPNLARYGQGYSDGDNWAPTAGIRIATRLQIALTRLSQEYLLPVEPELWKPDRIRAMGQNVINDGEAFKPSGRYPFAFDAKLCSAETAMESFIPRRDFDTFTSKTTMSLGDAYREVVLARYAAEKDAWWYRFSPTACWMFARRLRQFADPPAQLDPPTDPPTQTIAGGVTQNFAATGFVGASASFGPVLPRRTILPTMISFEVSNATGSLAVSIPETEQRRYIHWYTNPGGGWMNTQYPPPKKWRLQ